MDIQPQLKTPVDIEAMKALGVAIEAQDAANIGDAALTAGSFADLRASFNEQFLLDMPREKAEHFLKLLGAEYRYVMKGGRMQYTKRGRRIGRINLWEVEGKITKVFLEV